MTREERESETYKARLSKAHVFSVQSAALDDSAAQDERLLVLETGAALTCFWSIELDARRVQAQELLALKALLRFQTLAETIQTLVAREASTPP